MCSAGQKQTSADSSVTREEDASRIAGQGHELQPELLQLRLFKSYFSAAALICRCSLPAAPELQE